MSLWCLKDVDYDRLDFFESTICLQSTPLWSRLKLYHGRQNNGSETVESTPSNGAEAGSMCGMYERAGEKKGLCVSGDNCNYQQNGSTSPPYSASCGVRNEEDFGAHGSKHGGCRSRIEEPSGPSNNTTPPAYVAALIQAIARPHLRRTIPSLIANWPVECLRLRDVTTDEDLERSFNSVDEFWTCLLQGVMMLTKNSELNRLDLTQFLPSKGLVYTTLQLFPLLALPKALLMKSPETIYSIITEKLDLQDGAFCEKLKKFLSNVVGHRVFRTGHSLNLSEKGLTILLDYLNVADDSTNFLCYVTALGLQHLSRVSVILSSVVFDQFNADIKHNSLPTITMLLKCCASQNAIKGCGFVEIDRIALKYILLKALPDFTNLSKLSFSGCNLHLEIEPTIVVLLASSLQRLLHLRRLDLSGSFLAGNARTVLEDIRSPLEFLSLCWCCLNDNDVRYLTTDDGKFSISLRDLDISYIHPPSSPWTFEFDQSAKASYQDSTRLSLDQSFSSLGDNGEDINSQSRTFKGHLTSSKKIAHASSTSVYELLMIFLTRAHVLSELVLLDISNHVTENCEPINVLIEASRECVANFKNLRHFAMEDFPLTDDRIVDMVRTACSPRSRLQSLAVTRSTEAPELTVTERFAFWRRLHEAKGDRRLLTAIGNFVTENDLRCL